MKHFGLIYKALNLVNEKVYIGQTRDYLSHRKYKHFYEAYVNDSQLYFHRAIRKYGKENFIWDVLAYAETPEDLDNLERKYIAEYQANNSQFGYNLTAGGLDSLPDNGKAVICLETNERYSSIKETSEKIGVCIEFLTKSIKQRTSIAGFHYMYEEAPYSINEIVLTDAEDKVRLMKTFTTYKDVAVYGTITARSKPVVCIEAEIIFPSGTAASKFLGLTKDNVGATCRGVQETCYSLHWRYLTPKELKIWKERRLICLKDYK